MRFFIGYLIQGEAAQWQKQTEKQISHTFGTWDMHEKIPPHITLFRPFDVEEKEVGTLDSLLREWVAVHPTSGNFTMSSFGRFSDRAVFTDISTDTKALHAVLDLRTRIGSLIKAKEDFPDWQAHATLAYLLTPTEIAAIWDYVQRLTPPDFTLPFDNVTLFRPGKTQGWEVEKIYTQAVHHE